MKTGTGSVDARFRALVSSLEPLYGKGEAKSIAKIVFEDAFHIGNLTDPRPFPDIHLDRLKAIQERLLRHEPVQYVLGQADFYGLKFEVNAQVLIPRPETEELVHWVLECCKGKDLAGKRLLDVGSGSGCIPILIKKKLPDLEVVSLDISSGALEVASRNAEKHQTLINWRLADFLEPSSWSDLGLFDYVISNPPYIDPSEKGQIPPHVLDFEPHLALFTRSDPMEFYRALAGFGIKNLHPGGKIFVECNEFRLEEVSEIFRKNGYSGVKNRLDLAGKPRMLQIFR